MSSSKKSARTARAAKPYKPGIAHWTLYWTGRISGWLVVKLWLLLGYVVSLTVDILIASLRAGGQRAGQRLSSKVAAFKAQTPKVEAVSLPPMAVAKSDERRSIEGVYAPVEFVTAHEILTTDLKLGEKRVGSLSVLYYKGKHKVNVRVSLTDIAAVRAMGGKQRFALQAVHIKSYDDLKRVGSEQVHAFIETLERTYVPEPEKVEPTPLAESDAPADWNVQSQAIAEDVEQLPAFDDAPSSTEAEWDAHQQAVRQAATQDRIESMVKALDAQPVGPSPLPPVQFSGDFGQSIAEVQEAMAAAARRRAARLRAAVEQEDAARSSAASNARKAALPIEDRQYVGIVQSFGPEPFKGADEVFCLKLMIRDEQGNERPQAVWGEDLIRAIDQAQVQVGQQVYVKLTSVEEVRTPSGAKRTKNHWFIKALPQMQASSIAA